MTARFSAGPDASPASEAGKLPPNLISRFLPTFLIFLLLFFPFIHELIFTSDIRMFDLFLTSHLFSLLSTQIYCNSALVSNI